jgi:hypothetical protein
LKARTVPSASVHSIPVKTSAQEENGSQAQEAEKYGVVLTVIWFIIQIPPEKYLTVLCKKEIPTNS